MFTACPHCQFLVARDPHSGASTTVCPRCGKPGATPDEARAPAPSLATLLHVAPPLADTERVDTGVPSEDMPDVRPAAPIPVETRASAVHAHASVPQTDIEDVQADAEEFRIVPTDGAGREEVPATDNFPSAAAAPAPAVVAPAIAANPARKAAGPRFLLHARTTPVHLRRARLQWMVVVALASLLCLQVVIADRARLAMQAGWRPLVMALCGVVRCDVPTWREPDAFAMLSRDVRPLPGAPGTLQAQATFRNEARWPQAWPVILITLKDADGRTLGARALQPADYLPENPQLATIEPGQSAQMAVRIREPSASVVAFSFDFR